MRFVTSWLVLTAALVITGWIFPGVDADAGTGTYFVAAAVLAVVNLLIGPVLRLLSAPMIILTLGLFSILINAALLLLTDWLVDSFDVDGFWTAILASITISILNWLIGMVVDSRARHRLAT
jgi:putative membrane protein